jgi:hypothetical protein
MANSWFIFWTIFPGILLPTTAKKFHLFGKARTDSTSAFRSGAMMPSGPMIKV